MNFTDKFFYHYISWCILRNYNGKIMNKKVRKVRRRVTFSNSFIDKINPMVKFFCKYTDENNPSVYTNRITDDITVRFKKKNRTVM